MKKFITTLVALAAIGAVTTACQVPDDSAAAKKHPFTSKAQHQAKPPKDVQAAAKPQSNLTAGQEQAVGSAQDYLSTQAFSKTGLIGQLSSKYGEGFSKADATFAVNHIKVNWNEEAYKSAKDYLRTQHFSHAGLVSQLSSSYGEGFTRAQAEYGVKKAGL